MFKRVMNSGLNKVHRQHIDRPIETMRHLGMGLVNFVVPKVMLRWLIEMGRLVLKMFTVRICGGLSTIILVWIGVGVHLVRLWWNSIVMTCEKRFIDLMRRWHNGDVSLIYRF